jgi:hypothetical protein
VVAISHDGGAELGEEDGTEGGRGVGVWAGVWAVNAGARRREEYALDLHEAFLSKLSSQEGYQATVDAGEPAAAGADAGGFGFQSFEWVYN